ncbi:hypothetical protein [Fibrobacter sp. UWEL]|uniref:hypothetical protein n=1 Tax=Fibrobacter sp. UWEL TaxID=1896209 RepID=UPI000933A775|nr:hypothetical protein [Fibrobacter sp. UWEL]
MKRVSTTLALALGAFATLASAAQIQGFVSGYAPGDVKVKQTVNGVESNYDLHSDIAYSLGGEFLVFPAGPLMVGGGLGFVSVQKDGDNNVVMPAVPLFASVGVIGPERWDARPYFEARFGYPIPASKFMTWWNKPLNFYASANVGVQLPYHMGVELNWSYLTMEKNFKKSDADYRFNSMKFGGSITVHFDLFKSDDESNAASAVKDDVAAEPVAEPAAEENSYGYSSDESATESLPTEEPSYSDYYGEPAADQPAEESVTEESAGEQTPVSEEPYAGSDEQASEESEVASEEPASEDASPAEDAAEESVAEETPAEETVAEPEPEPEPTVAPAPEKKPAAKKASKKKAAKKSKAKKSSKKSKAKSKKKK